MWSLTVRGKEVAMLAKFRGGTAELQTEAGRWRGALSSLRTVLPDCRDSVDYFA